MIYSTTLYVKCKTLIYCRLTESHRYTHKTDCECRPRQAKPNFSSVNRVWCNMVNWRRVSGINGPSAMWISTKSCRVWRNWNRKPGNAPDKYLARLADFTKCTCIRLLEWNQAKSATSWECSLRFPVNTTNFSINRFCERPSASIRLDKYPCKSTICNSYLLKARQLH